MLALAASAAIACAGCAAGDSRRGAHDGARDSGTPAASDGDTARFDAGVVLTPRDGAPPEPNWDAFFAEDPPPSYCGPAGGGGTPPPIPGGTPECPDDKNREGCPCEHVGETASCWPGLRVDRDRGICRDGTTTCMPYDEFYGRWGRCEGYVLPVDSETRGPEACNCFSQGTWAIDNLSPCFVEYSSGRTYAVSTFIDRSGTPSCPTSLSSTPPPRPEPGEPWSTNRLNVDCAGQFRLCYTIRAGSVEAPSASDCVVGQACTEAWYGEPGTEQELAPLPGWSSSDATCAERFEAIGGYGEMSVEGTSIECEPIDDMGAPYVFHRVGYCPSRCNETPTLPECADCMSGGSGTF